MNYINFSGPINSLSFGNVSYNMLKSLYAKNIKICFFPIGKSIDMSAFDKADQDFREWLTDCYDNRIRNLSPENPSIRMWHLNGSESRVGRSQSLYTFYECDKPTKEEVSLCNIQDRVFFSSSHAAEIFKLNGCENSKYIPIGFDKDLFETGKQYLNDVVHFGLIGKFERRKNTAKILDLWSKKYGNDKNYQLTCCVNNPFFKEDQMRSAISSALGGEEYSNINFLPFLKTNSEMNELYNAIDINLSGMSGAEGWNLPAFNSACLGKWSVVLNCTSHKDWANKDNSVIVEPSGEQEIYDGIFFNEGQQFNQGSMSTFSSEEFYKACEKAISLHDEKNEKGVELKESFSYDNTINQILESIK
jgi:hypothetical protein